MNRKKRKDKQSATMKLTAMQRASLKTDREVLHDLGLKMPRITPKYWLAVGKLSDRDNVSPYFLHLLAARRGQQVIYAEMKQLGYTWQNGKWSRKR